ncbi:hypothetical protein SRHO_G00151230 [Serrasalmus rhombeus]
MQRDRTKVILRILTEQDTSRHALTGAQSQTRDERQQATGSKEPPAAVTRDLYPPLTPSSQPLTAVACIPLQQPLPFEQSPGLHWRRSLGGVT